MFAEQVRNNSFLLDALDAALLVAYYSYAFRELTDATAMQGAAEQPQGAPAQ
jgi:hypothetical protein